ncbi:MAG TPA: class I SAM-dependent methyltransferase [Clostridiaceae bacterium]|nr:class I SAM-dependent methyltransferase [Clostridiaceae bacterium]
MEFDVRAKNYDTRSKEVRAKALGEHLVEQWKKYDAFPQSVLDYGSGTGLVTVEVSPAVDVIYAFDESKPMVEKFKEKLADRGITNIHPLDKLVDVPHKVDCILSSLVFHHIDDINQAIKDLMKYLKPGGLFSLIELDIDDGTFHGDSINFTGHNGFDRKWLKEQFEACGLENVLIEKCYEGDKMIERKPHHYTMFSITGQKSKA